MDADFYFGVKGSQEDKVCIQPLMLLLSSLYVCIKNIRETQTPTFGKEGVNLQDAN